MAPGEDTINMRILWQDLIFTRNHKVIQYVLATGWENFYKGPIAKLRSANVLQTHNSLDLMCIGADSLFTLFGNGIFNTDGAEWKAHRALVRPFFGERSPISS